MHAPLRNATPTPSTPLPPPTPLPAPTFAQRLLAAQQSSGQAATHATMPQTPSLGLGQKAAQQNVALPPPMATDFTIQDESLPLPQDESLPHQDASHLTPSLINTLSAIAESSIDMISVGTMGPSNESHFTPPPANDFPITHRGIPGEFLIGLSPETVTTWCEVPSPKFFIRIFDYDGSNTRARHASLIGLVRIAIQEIAKTKGYADVDARIAPPTVPPIPTIHPLITFLVYDITQETATAILQQRIWSSPEVTFEAFPFDTDTIPSLTLCLTGFTTPDEKAARNAVLSAWAAAATITRLIDILQKLDPVFEGPARRHDAREAAAAMVLSIRAELVDFKEPGGVPSLQYLHKNPYDRTRSLERNQKVPVHHRLSIPPHRHGAPNANLLLSHLPLSHPPKGTVPLPLPAGRMKGTKTRTGARTLIKRPGPRRKELAGQVGNPLLRYTEYPAHHLYTYSFFFFFFFFFESFLDARRVLCYLTL